MRALTWKPPYRRPHSIESAIMGRQPYAAAKICADFDDTPRKSAPPPPVEAPLENFSLYGFLVRPKRSDDVSIPRRPGGTVVFT
jgi:hypothetical protein